MFHLTPHFIANTHANCAECFKTAEFRFSVTAYWLQNRTFPLNLGVTRGVNLYLKTPIKMRSQGP